MQKVAFKLLHDMESSWWYKGRKLIADTVMKRFVKKQTGLSVLDFGSGYGGMLGILQTYGEVSAYEVEAEAVESCKKRGYKKVFPNLAEVFSVNNRFDLVTLFDVMEHVENDKELADSLYKVIKPGGNIMVTVPAFQFLWSVHDVEHSHYRRYTTQTIATLLHNAGFEVQYASYWNMFLFLPAALMRLVGLTGQSSIGKTGIMDRIFYKLVVLESILIKYVSLPFGIGIAIIARKK